MSWRNQRIFILSGAIILLAVLVFGTGTHTPVLAQTPSGIAAPTAGSTVGGSVVVVGTATDVNFLRYEVAYSAEPSSDATFVYLGGNTEQVSDGPLAIWDTTALPSGTYTLRLRVVKKDGNYDTYLVENITVDQSPTPTATPIPTETPIPPTNTPTAAVTVTITRAAATATVATSTTLTATETVVDDTEALTTTVSVDATAETEVDKVTPAADTGIPVAIIGGDEGSLRLLLRYWLARFDGPSTQAITVSVGTLPVNLPLDLSLSQSISVVASIERTGEFEEVQIFLTAPDSTDLVGDLRTQLITQDFVVPPLLDDSPDQVFLDASDTEPTLFCSADNALIAYLASLAVAGESDAILLTLGSAQGSACATDSTGQPNTGRILPRLAAPVDARVLSSGGTRSTTSVSAEAELRSPLSASELALAYETQLLAEGWQLADQEGGTSFAWSAWQFVDTAGDAWNATFSIARNAGSPTSYFAMLRAEQQR